MLIQPLIRAYFSQFDSRMTQARVPFNAPVLDSRLGVVIQRSRLGVVIQHSRFNITGTSIHCAGFNDNV
jgi:hypothetical protein